MIVFNTVLEVNGNPVIYSVYKNSNLAFFNPFNKITNAPILLATFSKSSWDIKGTQDPILVNQVMKEVAA